MALNSGTSESAVLEIEVDTVAFEKGMNDVVQKGQQATNKLNKSFEFMGNSVKKTFTQNTEVAKKSFEDQVAAARKSWAMIAGTVAAGSLLVRKYFALMEKGSGEGAKSLKKLEESFEKLGATVGEQQASVWKPLFDAITSVNESVAESPGLISALTASALGAASSVLGMANAAGVLKDSLARLASGGSTEAELRAGNAAAQQGNLAAGLRDAASGTALGRAFMSIGRSLGRAATATVGGVTNAVAMNRIRRDQARNAGGGGGGGGGGAAQEDPSLVRARAVHEQILALQRQEAEAVVAARAATADRLQAANERRIDQEHQTANAIVGIQQSLSDTMAGLADEEIARAEVVGNAWRMQIEALKQMGMATLQVAAAQLLQSGSADKALRSGLSALGTMAGFRALFEGAEAIAAAVTPGMQGFAAGHAKAAAMFAGIAVGTVVAGKAIYGGNYGRQSNGSRGGGGGAGGGGDFAAPRGGGMGGGRQQNIERTYIIRDSGDLEVSDRALRRLAKHMRDLDDRGYES